MWINGTTKIGETEFTYQAKQYDLGSEFGINGGRISKLEIRRGGRTVAHYDRGWDIRPADKETEPDGSPKFPKAKSNAQFWRDMEEQLNIIRGKLEG